MLSSWLFILVMCIGWVSAGDGGFAGFCTHDLGGTLQDSKDPKEPGEKTCTATFDLDGVTPTAAASVCHHRGRFAVKEANADKNTLTCTWKTTGKCDSDHYIHRYCYQLAPTCPKDWKQANVNDRQAFRWIVLTFPKERLVHFNVPTNAKKPTKMYSNGVLLPAADGKSMEIGVLLQPMPVFRGRPGDLVFFKQDPKQRVYSVCRKLALGESSTALGGGEGVGGTTSNPTNNGPGAFGNRGISGNSKDIGNFTIWLTRNVYPNKILPNGEVDLKHFHNICEKLCDGCYAGTPDLMTNVAKELPNEIFWLAGSRGFIPAETSSCPDKPDDDLNNWKILHHPIHNKAITMKATLWKQGHPNRQCSDQGRYALAYLGGKALSVPIFDRLPLACIQGAQLPLPADVTNCFKNSENSKNGGCQCKSGFIDINDAKLLEKQTEEVKNHIISLNQKPGWVCVEETCKTGVREREVPLDTIIFLIDSSTSLEGDSFNKMREFLRDAGSWLPQKVAIWFYQYGTDRSKARNSPLCCGGGLAGSTTKCRCKWGEYSYLSSMTRKGWTAEEYRAEVDKVMTKQIYGASPHYQAIDEVANWWIKDASKVHHKAIMIMITDGDDREYDDGRPRRPEILDKVRKNGMKIKYVTVGTGNGLQVEIWTDVENKDEDIYKLTSYNNLKETLKVAVEQFMECAKITTQQIGEAMTRAYN